MSSDTLLSVDDPSLIESGIVKSLHSLQAPLWVDGENVIFKDQSVRKGPGYAQICPTGTSAPIRGMQDVLVSTTPKLFFGTPGDLYDSDGTTTNHSGTGFSGTTDETSSVPATVWSMESWGNFCVASNGVDDIQVNKNTGAGFVPLAGSPPRAKIIIRQKAFLLAINTSQNSGASYNIDGDSGVVGPAFFSFCDIDNIENWTGGVAGALNIRDMDGEILAAEPIADKIAVYTKNIMSLISYVGSPYYFGDEVALSGFGPVSKQAVIGRERTNYGFGRDGIWETDANSYKYIDQPDDQKWLQDNVNWAQMSKINGFLNERQAMLEWSFPTGTSLEPDTTICYCIDNGKFSYKPYGRTSGIAKHDFLYPITASSIGNIYYNEFGYNADGAAMTAFVQSKPLHCNQRRFWKTVSSVILHLHQLVGTGVYLYLGVQENLDDPISWLPPQLINTSTAPTYWSGVDGVFITLRVQSMTKDSDWALAAFALFGSLTGGID